MISSAIKVIACVFVVCLIAHAQNPVKKLSTGSISGKITLKGNGIAGIPVGARSTGSSRRTYPALVVSTDHEGNYRLSNVAAGEYEVMPAAPQFVLAGRQSIKRLIVGDGESIENVDFALLRGGVVTGKITDAEGRPVIDEPIELFGPEGSNEPVVRINVLSDPTDDRGIYRVYGLAPGKYKVAAGTTEDRLSYAGGRRAIYRQTFYRSPNESSNATLVEVTEGGEATNIDITLGRTQSVFTVTARVIDSDTGQPVPDARYGLQRFRENGSSASGGFPANKLGEITIENVTPGKYAIYLEPSPSRTLHAEPVTFEVVDQDIKDLVLKSSSGSSASGVIVLEGVEEKVARTKLPGLMVFAFVINRDERYMGGNSAPNTLVNADGSFTVHGLRPGSVQFSVWPGRGNPTTAEFEVARVERDGVVQANLEIKAGEQIKGLRLILKPRSGSISGLVKVENGQLTSAGTVYVSIRRVGDDRFATQVQLDDRGRFVSGSLVAGVYDVTVVAYPAGRGQLSAKQQVVVADNQVSEVTLTLNLKSDKDEDDEP